MALTEQQQKEFLNEVLDPEKVRLVCGAHQYAGVGMPNLRCKDCWMVYFVVMLAQTPPNLRGLKLQELDALIHHMVEEAEQGRFDFEPYMHPIIKIEKEN